MFPMDTQIQVVRTTTDPVPTYICFFDGTEFPVAVDEIVELQNDTTKVIDTFKRNLAISLKSAGVDPGDLAAVTDHIRRKTFKLMR